MEDWIGFYQAILDSLSEHIVVIDARGRIDMTSDRFYLEYACHSPSEKRWFVMTGMPLK